MSYSSVTLPIILPKAALIETSDYYVPDSNTFDSISMESGEPITMENVELLLITVEFPNV